MSRPGKFGSATEQLCTVCYAYPQPEGSETPRSHAFTVPEITITLCIMGVLTAIAVPRAGKLIDTIQVRGAVADIESAFSGARHIAIARSAQSTVEIDTTNRRIFVTVGGDTVRRRDVGAEHGVQISATRVRMSYAATGMGYGAANLSVVVRRSLAVDTVFVSRLGRLRH
ncbi:MAG: Tfp pilus assembly protein FimT/FimU [Gemmatimonadaceae bacterium]